MNLHDHDIRYEALAEGARQKAVEAAKAFLADGKYTPKRIAELLNIPVEAFMEKAPQRQGK